MSHVLRAAHGTRLSLCSTEAIIKQASGSRKFHASSSNRDLVAPPDPVSHMRPIIYDTPAVAIQPAYLRHPYSLAEFGTEAGPSNHELQFRLLRQQLDTLHQNFWLDSNGRFYAARDTILDSLPKTATAREKEEALSAFFQQWIMQEKEWTDTYTAEWRKRNLQLILLSARVEYQRLKNRLSGIFGSSQNQI
ncbi:hypothetical protein CPC08DRAFT_684783 [Agrocybe pediades]|nr:hypothetical protein CPC08DRAFT_684783 [Agrocybe pediades]